MKRIFIVFSIILFVSGCNSYSLEDAKKHGDIITGPPGDLNHEKIDLFMNDVKGNKESEIRITSYSEEGDPILSDLSYRNGTIEYSFDNSRDKHGGRDKGKYETQCERIETRDIIGIDEQDRVEYYLAGCKEIIGIHDSNKNEIFLMNKLR